MTWYTVLLHGPAVINDVYHPQTTRIVDGVKAANKDKALWVAYVRNAVERCDKITVQEVTQAVGEAARRCRDADEVAFLRQVKATIY